MSGGLGFDGLEVDDTLLAVAAFRARDETKTECIPEHIFACAALQEVRAAMFQSFYRMELTIESDERTETGYALTGKTRDRRVEIELEQVGGQFTYMQAKVKRNFFWRDRATATALVLDTESILTQVRLAGKNGASGTNGHRVSVADILRPVSLARNERRAWYSRSDEVRSNGAAPAPAAVTSIVKLPVVPAA